MSFQSLLKMRGLFAITIHGYEMKETFGISPWPAKTFDKKTPLT